MPTTRFRVLVPVGVSALPLFLVTVLLFWHLREYQSSRRISPGIGRERTVYTQLIDYNLTLVGFIGFVSIISYDSFSVIIRCKTDFLIIFYYVFFEWFFFRIKVIYVKIVRYYMHILINILSKYTYSCLILNLKYSIR